MMNVHVVLSFNETVYKLKSARMPYVPLLVPTLTYKVDVDIENIDPNGSAALVKVFVFNHDALKKLQLSSKRIHFYIETLQDLATRRDLKVYVASPYDYARENPVAVTYAPVPSFENFGEVAELHPFPWLRPPHDRNIKSFTAWRQNIK